MNSIISGATIQKQDRVSLVNKSKCRAESLNKDSIKKDNTTIISKLKSIYGKQTNQIVTRKEIIDKVLELYPGTNPTSVIPSDYCYNIINKAEVSFTTLLFEFLGAGNYKCVGENFYYEGDIYWKNEKVGTWKNGRPILTSDPRK